jgi:hypothetical protein
MFELATFLVSLGCWVELIVHAIHYFYAFTPFGLNAMQTFEKYSWEM